MIKGLLTLYASTALHPGAGSTTGAIDLPVQREVHTGFPVIAGSSVKGALKQHAMQLDDAARVYAVFGPPTNEENKYAGALLVGEAKLLALPVRSLQSVFYWVTCPLILERLARDLRQFDPSVQAPKLDPGDKQAITTGGSAAFPLVLEELDFTAQPNAELRQFVQDHILPLAPDGAGEYYRNKLLSDFAVVSDTDFQHLTRTGTEIAARIVLDKDTKTSENLWYEESLPSETLLWSFLLAQQPRGKGLSSEEEVFTVLGEVLARQEGLLQVGGNETLGQGWCYTRVYRGGGQ